MTMNLSTLEILNPFNVGLFGCGKVPEDISYHMTYINVSFIEFNNQDLNYFDT